MLGAQRVSPNEGKNPAPRLLTIAFCSSRNKILTDFSPSLDARLEGQRVVSCSACCLRWRHRVLSDYILRHLPNGSDAIRVQLGRTYIARSESCGISRRSKKASKLARRAKRNADTSETWDEERNPRGRSIRMLKRKRSCPERDVAAQGQKGHKKNTGFQWS
jgi:hypothetical protein